MLRLAALGALFVSAVAGRAQAPLSVEGIPERAPLTVQATATSGALVVELVLEAEWHAYARDVGGGQPVELTLSPDCDYRAAGALVLPPDDHGKLRGHVRLELPLAARDGAAGGALRATLALQVCDALECLAPMALDIRGVVAPAESQPFQVLLVVDEVDARSERILAFLAQRGFTVAVTTYADVTAEACEAHDVVLADSKLFGKTAKVRQHVLAFPRTATPIVAVGYFGTELIEAQGVAMTSGYI